jgi:hypothetical protein
MHFYPPKPHFLGQLRRAIIVPRTVGDSLMFKSLRFSQLGLQVVVSKMANHKIWDTYSAFIYFFLFSKRGADTSRYVG